MKPTDWFEDLATSFPSMWPQYPEWDWVNIHDGVKFDALPLLKLVDNTLKSAEVILLIHSVPGTALRVRREEIAVKITSHILRHNVQISDPDLRRFISINTFGMATADA